MISDIFIFKVRFTVTELLAKVHLAGLYVIDQYKEVPRLEVEGKSNMFLEDFHKSERNVVL